MSNWDPMLDAARQGTMPSLLPAGLVLPMVAPADLGAAAARLLREPVDETGIRHVEGPARHSPGDVADAFAKALGRPVTVAAIPRDGWIEAYRGLGFSEAAAASYAGMTALCVDGGFDMPADPERRSIPLADYIAQVVATEGHRAGGAAEPRDPRS